MMGRQTGNQASLFYEFRLDDRIPKDHLLRRIDVFVTSVLGGVRAKLQPYYSEIGRPSVDPELMMRMLILGYCYGLRSERKLTKECMVRPCVAREFVDLAVAVLHQCIRPLVGAFAPGHHGYQRACGLVSR